MAGSIRVDRPNAADSTFGYLPVEPPTHLTTYLINIPLINLNLYAQSKLDTLDYVACARESCGRYTKYLKICLIGGGSVSEGPLVLCMNVLRLRRHVAIGVQTIIQSRYIFNLNSNNFIAGVFTSVILPRRTC